jgi:Family of unknown function (DUF6252)
MFMNKLILKNRSFAILLFQLLTISISLHLNACGDSGVNASDSFSCKINGKSFKIAGVGAYAAVFSSKDINIYGTESGNTAIKTPRTMYLAIDKTIEKGTHPFKNTVFAIFEDTDKTFFSTNFNTTPTENGSIIISEKTESVLKGSFSFIADSNTKPVKKISVTEGSFSVRIR